MARKLLFILLLAGSQAAAQPTYNDYTAADKTTIFFDDFIDSKSGFSEGSFTSTDVNIYSGGLHIYNKTDAFWMMFLVGPTSATYKSPKADLATYRDFEIEMNVRYVSGVDNNSIGLSLGANYIDNTTINDYTNFGFSANGYYIIYRYIAGTYTAVQPWTTNASISKDGYNLLTVRKVGTTVHFFLNKEHVYSMPFTPFAGENYGINFPQKTLIDIDYLRMSYLEKKAITPPTITLTSPAVQKGYLLVGTKILSVKGTVTDNDGIFDLQINGADVPVSATGYFAADIPLAVGENSIIIKARDTRMAEAEQTFVAIRQTGGIQNQTVSTVSNVRSDVDENIPTTTTVNEKTFAVIIANEEYQREVQVEHAANDGKIFKEYCEKTLGIPTRNIHYAENATFGTMKSEIKWITDVSNAFMGEAKIIFYYAGHGMPDEKSQSAYLLPVDGFSSDFETAIKVDDLYSRLSGCQAASVTVFMDACFSGSQRNNGMLANARGVKVRPKTEPIKGKMVVFSAASGDETAYPFSEKQHGLFTYFLLKKLKDTAGNVTYKELSDYITTNVRQQSIVVNQKSQTPQILTGSEATASWGNWKIK
jgi:hypothetical protein